MTKICVIFFSLLLLVKPVAAEKVDLQVNRAGSDLYTAPAEGLYIQTQYCFASADAADAQLVFNTAADKLVFAATGESCDVLMIFGKATMKAGDYRFSVTRAADNWYRIEEQNAALLTEGCLTLIEGGEARVTMTETNDGRLVLPEVEEECRVVGAYVQADLTLEEVPLEPEAEQKVE